MVFAGCGYNFGRGYPVLKDTKKLFIDVVRNNTTEAGVERYFTMALYNEFNSAKTFQLVSRDDADATLETTITFYSVTPVFFDPSGRAIQYRVSVKIRSVMRDREGNILVDSNEITDEDEYFIENNVIDIKRREHDAVKLIAEDVAEEILDLITGN